MAACFDASGFLGLSQSILRDYKTWWDTYERIQTINSNISTQRAQGNRTLTYYTYLSFDEKISFLNGQMLHVRQYPNSNWAPVLKN